MASRAGCPEATCACRRSRALARREEYEQADEDEHRVIAEQAKRAEPQRHDLPTIRGHARRLRRRQAQRSDAAPARRPWETGIRLKATIAMLTTSSEASRPPSRGSRSRPARPCHEQEQQDAGDDHVHRRPGRRHRQLLRRLLGHVRSDGAPPSAGDIGRGSVAGAGQASPAGLTHT
jgi:hypothetical protein